MTEYKGWKIIERKINNESYAPQCKFSIVKFDYRELVTSFKDAINLIDAYEKD